MIHNRIPTKFQRELIVALESARTRLAVAIAAETKSTPPERWQYYLETAAHTRRFIKKVRRANADLLQGSREWIDALETLKHLPAQSKALRLAQLLRDLVAGLE